MLTAALDLSDHPECPGLVIPSRLLNGKFVDLWNLQAKYCTIDIIANALSQINRYAGQTPYPYSVAQHSVLVSGLLSFNHAYEGLMHDATEGCGLSDVVSPLKRKAPIIKVVEARMRCALAPVYGLEYTEPAIVKQADELAYQLERWILHSYPAPKGLDRDTYDYARDAIAETSYARARNAFLDTYELVKNQAIIRH